MLVTNAGSASNGHPCFLDFGWQATSGTPLARLVIDLGDMLKAKEVRQRARTVRAERAWHDALDATICGLARQAVLTPSTSLVVTLANARQKTSRYSPFAGLNVSAVHAVLRALADNEVVAVTIGSGKTIRRSSLGRIPREASFVTPSRRFVAELFALGANLGDMRQRLKSQEVIVLTEKTREQNPFGPPTKNACRVEYDDTRKTTGFRCEVDRLNAFLAQADIRFIDDGLGFIDTGDRALSRHFSQPPQQERQRWINPPRFDLGGRLFGAFWSNLERSRRRTSLRINGQPIAEVDLHAAFTRLAYARLGIAFPTNTTFDPYALPGCEAHRTGVKKALNAFLFSPDLKRLPNDVASELPKGMTAATMRAAILHHLPGLEACLGADTDGIAIGFHLMFTESQIVLSALAKLMALGVVALPLHDALLVRRDLAQVAKSEIEAAALRVAGVVIPAHIKEGKA